MKLKFQWHTLYAWTVVNFVTFRMTSDWKISKWFNLFLLTKHIFTLIKWRNCKVSDFAQLCQRYLSPAQNSCIGGEGLISPQIDWWELLSTVCPKVDCVDAHLGLSDFWRIKVKRLGFSGELAIATCAAPLTLWEFRRRVLKNLN